jgi:serine/threonine protein kinase
MAPDLLNPALSLASPDPRWDVYATAMIIYELLLGAHPLLVGETEPPPAALVIAWQLTRPIPPACGLVPGVSLLTAAALARALEKDPRQRFESMALFEAVLDECLRRELASESVAAGTPPAVGPAADLAAASAALGAPPARAPRRWLPRDDGDWLALAIGAAIGLGLGLWWWGPWGAP